MSSQKKSLEVHKCGDRKGSDVPQIIGIGQANDQGEEASCVRGVRMRMRGV